MGAGVAGLCVLGWLAALCVYDIRERRLPNWLTLPGAAAVLIVATAAGHGGQALLGALALFVVYLAIHVSVPRALGGGDVKLAIGVGALTGAFGADVWALAAMGAPLLTAIVAMSVFMWCAESVVPHGPSMCLATACAVGLALL